MLKIEAQSTPGPLAGTPHEIRVAVIWIDWYAYHVARFLGLARHPVLGRQVAGIELVGGVGVHAGLKFRDGLPDDLPVETLFPENSWQEVKGRTLARALWKRLNQLDPSVVLIPGYYTLPGFAAAIWAKLHRRRSVLMTESTEADHRRVRLQEALKGFLVRVLFDWAVAGGAPHKRYLQRLGFRSDRIAGFYDVVDNEFFRERTQALRKHSQTEDFDLPKQYFLYVGRLAEEKNISYLLESYFAYRSAGGAWSLVLVGDGPERSSLAQAAAASAFGRDVYFPGLKTTAELAQYYAFASCFVLPSSREPWGLVVNEAMASGLPVILSKKCGCAEDLLLEGENGLVFEQDRPGDFTRCLLQIGNANAEALLAMGHHSEQIIAHFSPDAWAAEIARIATS